MNHARTKFVALCEGINSRIGSLTIDENFTDEEVDLPIDTFIADLTGEDSFGEDIGEVVEM